MQRNVTRSKRKSSICVREGMVNDGVGGEGRAVMSE